MLSIFCNSCVKSWINVKTCRKNEKIKPFINKYKWEGKPFPSEKDDWKKLRKVNLKNLKKSIWKTKNIVMLEIIVIIHKNM